MVRHRCHVQRGELSDVLILQAHHLEPNLGSDLFTIQNSNLLSDSQVDPSFKNFGLAWYQTDVQADSNGEAEVPIKTISRNEPLTLTGNRGGQ